MKIPENPCRYCVPPKRTEDCHAYCSEYIDWSALSRKIKQESWAKHEGTKQANERLMDVSARLERRKHMNGR